MNREKGAINPQGLIMLGISMILLAVSFITYTVVIEGVDSITEMTAPITQTDTAIVIGNTTIGNWTLSAKTLYRGDVGNVLGVTSNATNQPTADNYTGTELYCTGMTGNVTQLIKTTYLYGPLPDMAGTSQVLGIAPLLVLIGLVTAAVITGIMGIKITKGG